jgi:hypothetical protein
MYLHPFNPTMIEFKYCFRSLTCKHTIPTLLIAYLSTLSIFIQPNIFHAVTIQTDLLRWVRWLPGCWIEGQEFSQRKWSLWPPVGKQLFVLLTRELLGLDGPAWNLYASHTTLWLPFLPPQQHKLLRVNILTC